MGTKREQNIKDAKAIDLTRLPKGLYFIKINENIIKQIVKK